MKTLLVVLALVFFGLAGLTFTGTLQELIPFQGLANEIAVFSLAVTSGAVCLGALVIRDHTRHFAPSSAPNVVAHRTNLPEGSFHYKDIEVEADRWEEREALVREIMEMEK
jgi:hypothetical protein